MDADDVEFGHIVDLTLGEPAGTELVAAASVGATTLTVDYAGDFEDTGSLTLNGEVLPYTSIAYGDAEGDPDTITLADPLAVAASTDDKVGRMAGGEPVLDWLFHFSQGDGHPADIPIPFEQRAFWSNVEVDEPIPAFASADLERMVEIPGRQAILDPSKIGSPLFRAYLDADSTIPDSAFTTVDDWTVNAYDATAFTYDGAGGLTLHTPGSYLSVVTTRWAPNTTGRRQLKVISTTLGVDSEELDVSTAVPSNGVVSQALPVLLQTTEPDTEIRCEVFQNSTAGLALRGDATGRLTSWRVLRLR